MLEMVPYPEYQEDEPEKSEKELLDAGLSECRPLRERWESLPGQVPAKCYVKPHRENNG